jgi:hypothetical protein
MASGGIRLGAWDYLCWRHMSPVTIEGEVLGAKVRVYADEPEEYYAFITPEAYFVVKDWMDFHASYGKKVIPDSWIKRYLWQTTNMKYGARRGLATYPKRLEYSGQKAIGS